MVQQQMDKSIMIVIVGLGLFADSHPILTPYLQSDICGTISRECYARDVICYDFLRNYCIIIPNVIFVLSLSTVNANGRLRYLLFSVFSEL